MGTEIVMDGEFISTIHGNTVFDTVRDCGMITVFRAHPKTEGRDELTCIMIEDRMPGGDLIPRRVFGRSYGIVKKSRSGTYVELTRVTRLRSERDCDVLSPLGCEKSLRLRSGTILMEPSRFVRQLPG